MCLFLAKGDDMSIKAMTWVWDNSTQKSTNLLMLLAIADFCNDEGICYPSVPRLAKKCRLQDRGARKVIFKLQDIGEITVVVGGHEGRKKGRNTNLYYLNGYRQSIGLPIQKCLTLKNTPVLQDTTPVPQDRSTPVPQDRSTPVPQDTQTINIDPSIKKHTHTDRAQFRESKNSPKKSVCVLDELNDFEKAAWKWAQDHDFWKGRITNVQQLRTNLVSGKSFRVQFEQANTPAQPTRSVVKPINGKKAKLGEKKIKAKDCPYCNERGIIELHSHGRMDFPACPHDPEEIKQLALKKGAIIKSAKPGHDDPTQLNPVQMTPAEKAKTREKLEGMIGGFQTI